MMACKSEIETTARLSYRAKEANQNQLLFSPRSPFSVHVCVQNKHCEIRLHLQWNCMAGSKGQTIPNTRMTAAVGS